MLWNDFFADAVYRGLRHKPLVYVLKYLIEGGSSFSGKADEFKKEMEALFFKKEKKRLFDEIEPKVIENGIQINHTVAVETNAAIL